MIEGRFTLGTGKSFDGKQRGPKRSGVNLSIALALSLIFLLSIIPSALALGISPAKKIVEYEEGQVMMGTILIVNNERKEMRVSLESIGELGDSISIETPLISFSHGEFQKTVSYSITAPPDLEPGIHKAEIVAKELNQEGEGGVSVGSALSVVFGIEVIFPFPGKYIDAQLDIKSGEPNQAATFYVRAQNRGEEDIEGLLGSIAIEDREGISYAIVLLPSQPLKKQGRAELKGDWEADAPMGHYTAKALVSYDSNTLNLEKGFILGSFFLSLSSIKSVDFEKGDITRIPVGINNLAYEDVEALVEINLIDPLSKSPLRASSLPTPIPGLLETEAGVFFDTDGLEDGEYPGSLKLSYGGNLREYPLLMKISGAKMEFDIEGIAWFSPEDQHDKIPAFAIAALILIAMAAAAFAKIMHKKRK